MRLNFDVETYGGKVPFIDSDVKRMLRGGVTIEAAWCRNNRIESQGQVVLRDGRAVLLAGSTICQNGAGGLWRVYTPQEAAVAATLAIGDPATDNAILLTADTAGAASNDIRVQLVDPGATSGALSVAVMGNKIEVTLAATGGAVTSDADAVVAAINADTDASALVTAAVHPDASDGTGVMEGTDAFTNLDGGADAVAENVAAANNVALLWDDVDLEDGNAAVAALEMGRVLIDRLPFSDATSRAAMAHIKFIATS